MPQYDLFLATEKDIPELLACAEKAFLESPYVTHYTFSKDRVEDTIRALLKQEINQGYVLLGKDAEGSIKGVFAGMISYTTMGLEKTAMELLWWVAPEARNSRLSITMIKAYEYWANKLGVTKLVLGSMENEHSEAIHKFYERQGYSLSERTYKKELK